MLIADTHTHLHFSSFDKDREKVVARCRETGVDLQIQIGCDELSSLSALELAKKHDNFYATLGVHPSDVLDCFNPDKLFRSQGYENYELQNKNFADLFTWFTKLTTENPDKIVGFGETGFDLYHQNSPEIYKIQKEVFLSHLKLAKKFKKPLIIHGRNANEEMKSFFTENIKAGEVNGVIHCFCEDLDYGKFFVDKFGFFLGVGGILTYPNAEKTREAIKEIPLEFLVTETDSPFLVPQSLRKTEKRNESSFLPEVIELIAELKKTPTEKCAEILFNNAQRLFQI